MDQYKIGTVTNSTSTMHKLTSKPITIDCFETDDMDVLNHFLDYNLESSELLHLHRENDLFIMYFHDYTIRMKM